MRPRSAAAAAHTLALAALMKPRILFISHTAEQTGPTTSLRLLIDHLRERFDVGVIVPRHGSFADRADRAGIPVFVTGRLNKAAIPGLVRLMRGFRPALVYGNNTSKSCENALIAARLSRVPFICHVRGMALRKGWWSLGYLRLADAAVAVSQACADSIGRYAGRCPVHVVYNGVALPSPEPGRAAALGGDSAATLSAPPTAACETARDAARAWLESSLGLDAGAPLIVGIAHICPRKGQVHAVRALRRVMDQHPDARLILAGALDRDPDYTTRLRDLIDTLGLTRHVHLPGFRHDTDRMLAAADVFVHSALADPHPRAVIEAMAAGVPVAAFAVDGVAETVLDGRTGRLVPAGDDAALARVLTALLHDPPGRARMADAARLRVAEHFSAEQTARRVGDIIDATLRRRGHTTPDREIR